MQPTYEQYAEGCQMISLLTNLEVQLFDNEGVSQLHYARYDLPGVLEGFKQEALVQILQQPLVREHVNVFRGPFQLEFLAVGMWHEAEYRGLSWQAPVSAKRIIRNCSMKQARRNDYLSSYSDNCSSTITR